MRELVRTLQNCVAGQIAPVSKSLQVGLPTFARRLVSTLFLLTVTASAALAQTTVTVQWDRNSDNRTAGYRVYYGTSPGTYPWSVDAGNQTSAPIALSPGSVYYFTVRAYNASVQYGAPSNVASINLGQTSTTPAPTARITATMQSANTALVTWQTTNAVRSTLNGSLLSAASGSTSVNVSATTTFTLVATNSAGVVATQSATVTVPSRTSAATAEITATAPVNGRTTVTWRTTLATSIWITATNGGYYAVGPTGSAGLTVSGPTTFTLHARGADGQTVTDTVAVGSTSSTTSAPTAQITATLGANNYATVTWRTSNATAIWITATNGGYYAVGPSGSAGIAVTGPTTFTVNARSADGRTVTATATVGSTSSGTTSPTADITAVLETRSYAKVTWRATNATSVWITGTNGGYYAVGPSGTAGIAVTGPTTFTLYARAADGRTVTDVVTVTP